jgi:hypothetical protein
MNSLHSYGFALSAQPGKSQRRPAINSGSSGRAGEQRFDEGVLVFRLIHLHPALTMARAFWARCWVDHYAAKNLSSKMANWVFAVTHSRGCIFHVLAP